MARKRSRRKRRAKEGPAAGKPVSSTAKRVGERIAAAGPDYLQNNFIRIMQGGAALRQEPEFADLYFEPRQTLEAAARQFPRFSQRLRRVARRDENAVAPVYDDYRIAVLNDLDTPQFRQQLQRRLEQCIDRLKYGHDVEKLETALFISVLLSNKASKTMKGKKPLPLGVYSLVTTMYEDSFDRAMEETPEARDIVGDDLYELWCAKHSEKDLAAIAAATEQISAFEELSDHLETNPALAQAWRRQESYLIDDLQMRLAQGGLSLSPGFFTADEVTLSMRKMEQQYWNKPWSLSRYVMLLAIANFVHCIRETVDEIVSPQRIAEMIERWQFLGQHCMEAEDKRLRSLVPHVQAAIHQLQSEKMPSRNRVITTIYLLDCLDVWRDTDALSPRWQQFFKHLQRSRLWRKVSEDVGL
jgi:hypothetical protein